MQDLDAQIVALIPRLRRYARMITGSREAADAWIEKCIADFMTKADATESPATLRLSLFKAFHKTYLDIHRLDNSAEIGQLRLHQAMAELPPVDRQLLMLVTIEEFSPQEAGDILGLYPEEVETHLADARRSLQERLEGTVLIIEDEPLVAQQLSDRLADMGFETITMARTMDDALAAAAERPPRLVLADVELSDGGSGISAARELMDRYNAPVVFVTGYPERLLHGELGEPAFLVRKPYTDDVLRLTIQQALQRHLMMFQTTDTAAPRL